MIHPEQQSQALGTSSPEIEQSWKALLDAVKGGNPSLADSVDAINQQTANFLSHSQYVEPYQQRFTQLLQKIINHGSGAEKQLENKKSQLETLETQIIQKNEQIREAQSAPQMPFRINGIGLGDVRRNQLQNELGQLQVQKSQLQRDITDLQGQVKNEALAKSSLFAEVMTYLKQCESFYHYQAEAALASVYLNFIGDDASGSISQYVQSAIERIKRSDAVRPAIAEALKSAKSCADLGDFWQAMEKTEAAQVYLLRQERDPATQDAIKSEITAYSEPWSRTVTRAESQAQSILQMLDGADLGKAEKEWDKFRDQYSFYPGRFKTENRIVDVIYRDKLQKFQQVLAISVAQARQLFPQLTNDVTDPYMRSLLLARLDAALKEHGNDVPTVPSESPKLPVQSLGTAAVPGGGNILMLTVIGILVVTIAVLFLKLRNVRKP